MIHLVLAALIAATPATFPQALAQAKTGDTVQLSGNFGALVVQKAPPGVSIDASGAAFTYVYLSGLSGLTWSGGTFAPVDWHGGFYVLNSQDITVSGLSTRDAGSWPGFSARKSSNITLGASRFDRPSIGITIEEVSGGTVSGNSVVGASIDGIDIAGSHGLRVVLNGLSGNIPAPGVHADGIQLWSLAGEAPTSDIYVGQNLVFGHTQGVTAFPGNGGYDRITFDGNTVIGDEPQGIALYGARASTVENNRVMTLPVSNYEATVNVVGADAATVVCGNTVAAAAKLPARTEPACK